MKIFVFGSSITSCYWNGAATYYRGIYRNLAALGHDIIFAEPDIYGRQQNRDRHDVNYAEVIVYRTPDDIDALLARAAGAGLVVKHSGVGADDELLEERVIECRSAQHASRFLGCRCARDPGSRGGRSRRSFSPPHSAIRFHLHLRRRRSRRAALPRLGSAQLPSGL